MILRHHLAVVLALSVALPSLALWPHATEADDVNAGVYSADSTRKQQPGSRHTATRPMRHPGSPMPKAKVSCSASR